MKPLDIEPENPSVLIIENEHMLNGFCKEIYDQIRGEEGGFHLSDGEDLDIKSNVDLLPRPWEIRLNESDVLKSLYKSMNKDAYDEEMCLKSLEISSFIETYVQKLADRQPFNIICHQPLLSTLFKLTKVEFCESESLLDNIFDYFLIKREYMGIRLFITIDLKSFLSPDDLKELFKFTSYNELNLLMIENKTSPLFTGCNTTTIDGDLCTIDRSNEPVDDCIEFINLRMS